MKNKTDIIWLDNVKSTNEEARRHIPDIDNLSVLSAFEQTEGRGQHDRKWVSAPGENLTFSIVLKEFGIKAREQTAISQATALSLTDLLAAYGIKASIKWPNDIYVIDRKICGILIENSLKGNDIDWSIIGIGLNVNQLDFPEELPNPTSMGLCNRSKHPYNIRRLLEEFIRIFTGYYREYLYGDGKLETLEQQYVSKLRTDLASPQ